MSHTSGEKEVLESKPKQAKCGCRHFHFYFFFFKLTAFLVCMFSNLTSNLKGKKALGSIKHPTMLQKWVFGDSCVFTSLYLRSA